MCEQCQHEYQVPFRRLGERDQVLVAGDGQVTVIVALERRPIDWVYAEPVEWMPPYVAIALIAIVCAAGVVFIG